MKRLLITAALVGSLATLAQEGATVYRWTDAEGEIHYTDNPSNIPERYRKQAEKTAGDELFEVRPADGEPRSPTGGSGSAVPVATSPDEETWRERFGKLHEQIAALEAALERDRALLKRPPTLYGGVPQFNPQAAGAEARIEKNEKALTAAREALEDLDREASRAAVPRTWREPGR